MVRRALIIGVAMLGALALAPAQAATAPVTLVLSFAEPVATVPWASCDVQVEAGADGIAVLDAAQAQGCIDSYEAQEFDFGTFIDCIDGICSTVATYWRMTENGEMTAYGVDGFEANAGDVLGFSYTTWLGCLADPSLC